MTPAPRDRAHPPIGDHIWRNAKRRSDSAITTEGINQFSSHASLSQIVTFKARLNCHSLSVDEISGWSHSVTMESHDKNGGPNHLRAWREYRQLTQAQVAERVGTNSNMIGYLESGERGLTAKWLRKP